MSFKSPPSADAASSSMTLQHWRDGRLVWELTVPKAVHGALVNDGYFSSGAAWASGEDKVAYTAEVRRDLFEGLSGGSEWRVVSPTSSIRARQGSCTVIFLPRHEPWLGVLPSLPVLTSPCSERQVPPSEKTPAWCGPETLKDKAGPKSWRGVGSALEDWGELNTGV